MFDDDEEEKSEKKDDLSIRSEDISENDYFDM